MSLEVKHLLSKKANMDFLYDNSHYNFANTRCCPKEACAEITFSYNNILSQHSSTFSYESVSIGQHFKQ